MSYWIKYDDEMSVEMYEFVKSCYRALPYTINPAYYAGETYDNWTVGITFKDEQDALLFKIKFCE